jgi:ABC-type Mn2+/Zn2+ transport system permease subunit/Mn-dependent DtxR family transcriptional regulator
MQEGMRWPWRASGLITGSRLPDEEKRRQAAAIRGLRLPFAKLLAVVFFLYFTTPPVMAARIGDVTETSVLEQAARFFTFQDASLRIALVGCILLGLNCGLLGSFIVVRRLSLVGDTLSHAVLPGIALGFLWNMSKDPVAILVGATLVGGLAMLTVTAITRTTRLKEDAAMGLVLSSFYAVGICLLTMFQHLPTANKSGLDKFLFGQAAAMNGEEVAVLGATSAISLAFIIVCWRGLLTLSFHREFGESLGLPVAWLHHVVMLLTAFAVVTAMQAVGVVLVSAMLIIPAATAYLLTDRMHRLIVYAAVVGVLTAALGAFFSFLGNNLPTGPFMVLAGSMFFGIAFLFSPKHGWLTRLWRQRSRQVRTERENTLKAMYRVLEERGGRGEGVSLVELAQWRRETLEEVKVRAREVSRAGLVTASEDGAMLHFTPEGLQCARAIVRNHRLWELYLTNVMQFGSDHVHEDAGKIEHVLGEDLVRQLERRLEYPETDPHGRKIPGWKDAEMPTEKAAASGTGYR